MSGTDDDRRRAARTSWAPRAAHLFVVLCCDSPLDGGARLRLDAQRGYIIGRGTTLDVAEDAETARLALPGGKVSEAHARVSSGDYGWILEDLESTNGSFVNGRRVSRHVLRDGDVIEIGRKLLLFRAALETAEESRAWLRGTREVQTLVPALAANHAVLLKAGTSDLPILLLGPTGSGKEVAARAVHAASGRRGEFVAVNCAALPEGLMESQLFGHVRGAFSGATRDEIGYLRRANGGTLFLDEIGDLPRAAQGVLLRVLQDGAVLPVGSTMPVQNDVRVVAATHQPLDAMVERGEFRIDLYARLQGFVGRVPPLAERREDLGLLMASMLPALAPKGGRSVTLDVAAGVALVKYTWPLNVRELKQALAHAIVLAPPDGSISVSNLPTAIAHAPAGRTVRSPEPATTPTPEETALRERIAGELRRHRGNVAAVARAMGKAPMQVYRLMSRWGLDPDVYRR